MNLADKWELRKLRFVSKEEYFGSSLLGEFDSQLQAETEVQDVDGQITYVDLEGKVVYFRM